MDGRVLSASNERRQPDAWRWIQLCRSSASTPSLIRRNARAVDRSSGKCSTVLKSGTQTCSLRRTRIVSLETPQMEIASPVSWRPGSFAISVVPVCAIGTRQRTEISSGLSSADVRVLAWADATRTHLTMHHQEVGSILKHIETLSADASDLHRFDLRPGGTISARAFAERRRWRAKKNVPRTLHDEE